MIILKKALKAILVLIVMVSALIFAGMSVHAAVQIPENIRIGLFFNDSATHTNTAVASFKISAEKGLQFGFEKEGKFTSFLETSQSEIITIRKDTYFVDIGMGPREYLPSDGPVDGQKTGPYHILLKNSVKNHAEAVKAIEAFGNKGIAAYAAYVNGWQVWTGFYESEEAAGKDLEDSVVKKLGKGEYSVIMPDNSRIVALDSQDQVLFVYQSETDYLRIFPGKENNPSILKVNNTLYRGSVEVRRQSGSDMTVINILPLEQYLYGVVPVEIGTNVHIEAMKAQAVTARTYAVGNMNKYKRVGFNLCSTTKSQVYKGYSWENEKCSQAVDETSGKVITYDGKLASAFYFASSGGRTENSENVWGYAYPYLKSVEDKYENEKRYNYYWETNLTAQQIKDVMINQNSDIGDIIGITITKVSEAGRATEMVVKGTKGERLFTKEGCRKAFNMMLPSQWFTISTDVDPDPADRNEQTVKESTGGSGKIEIPGLGENKNSEEDSGKDESEVKPKNNRRVISPKAVQLSSRKIVTRKPAKDSSAESLETVIPGQLEQVGEDNTQETQEQQIPKKGRVIIPPSKKTNREDQKEETSSVTQDPPANEKTEIKDETGKDETIEGNGTKENDQKEESPKVPTIYTLNGRGYGHGVGMSQNGAMGMADAGFTFDQILKHYFQGVEIE